ncbi:MAG: DUF2141 domain-containing protein [Pseudomonadota bacterium]
MIRTLAAIAALAPVAAYGADVSVALSGLPSTEGAVEVSLCTEETWMTKDCETKTIRADADPLAVAFADVAPGVYAVIAVHDENTNGKLDLRWYGAPKEVYGVSNNPPLRRGPDRFEDARFDVGEDDIELSVVLRGWGEGRR